MIRGDWEGAGGSYLRAACDAKEGSSWISVSACPFAEQKERGTRDLGGLTDISSETLQKKSESIADPNSVPISANGSSILSAEQRKTFESSFFLLYVSNPSAKEF